MLNVILEFLFISAIMVGSLWFCYMSFHVVEEQKQGKYLPLPWEDGGFLKELFKKFRG
jgi:hypothetical protein